MSCVCVQTIRHKMTGREEVMLARLPQLSHLGQTAVKPILPPHILLPHQQWPSIHPTYAPENSPLTKQSRHTSNKLFYSSRDSRPTTSASGHVLPWLDDSRPSAHLLHLLHLTRHWSAYSLSDVTNRSNVRCSSNGSSSSGSTSSNSSSSNSTSSSSSSSGSGSSEHKPSVLLDVLRGELDFYGNARRSISHIQRRASGNDRRQAENEDTPATSSGPLPSNASCPLLLSADRRKRHAFHLDVPRDANQMSHLTPSPLKKARLVTQDNTTVPSHCRQQHDLVTQLPDYCTTSSRVSPVTISTDVDQGRTSVNVRDIRGSVDKGEGCKDDDNAYKCSSHPPVSQMLAHCTTAAKDKSNMSSSSSSLFEFSLDAERKGHSQLGSRGYNSEASPTSSLDEALSNTGNCSSRDEGTHHQLSPQDAVSISQHTSMQTQTRVAGWMVAIVRWAANQEEFCALPHTERRQLLHQAWSRLLLLHMTDFDFHFQVNLLTNHCRPYYVYPSAIGWFKVKIMCLSL
jgi:hypothetical protein